MSIGFWSATDSPQELFTKLVKGLEVQGATVAMHTESSGHVRDHSCFGPHDEAGDIEILDCSDGSLVEIVWSIGAIDHGPWSAWKPVRDSVAPLIRSVRPTLAVVAEESSNRPLPDPDWTQAESLFAAGWVDIDTCAGVQRVAFLKLKDDGMCVDLNAGLWWNSWQGLGSEAAAILPRRRDLAAAVYQAWTGRVAPPPEPVMEPSYTTEDLAPPQLWFWSHTRPASELSEVVERAVHPRGLSAYVWDFGQPSPWPFAIAQFMPQGRSVDELLGDLRAALGEMSPSWAGLQPKGGFLMPGPEVDHPAMAMIDHPWVRRSWIGSDLPRLETVLAGCHREDVAEGILWVTDPTLAPNSEFTEDWYDADERFERLSKAADILSQAARRSVGLAP
jgi:hypothetical protein